MIILAYLINPTSRVIMRSRLGALYYVNYEHLANYRQKRTLLALMIILLAG
jgi:hypothetical protein